MTDVMTPEVAARVAAAVAAEDDEPTPLPEKVTLEQLEDGIFERAGLTREQVGELPMVSRIPFQNPWEEGKAPPGNAELYILAMFDGAHVSTYVPGDVRVYVMPLVTLNKPSTESHWCCYTLSRVMGNVPTIKTMPRETWIGLVSSELEALWTATWGEE